MAQDESRREDLLREATALVRRIELAPADGGAAEHVVAGFRADGAMSIYFGEDPAYHFNSAGELRRAYRAGLLVKAESGRLVSLNRRRQENEVQLLRHALSDGEQAEFMAIMSQRLGNFERQCRSDGWTTVGEVPAGADILTEVLAFLTLHRHITIAKSPHSR